MLNLNTELTVLTNSQITGSGGSTSELDISVYEGNIFIVVDDRAGGTAVATVVVEHSEVTGSGFSAVPAAAIYDGPTQSGYTDLSTSASSQTRKIIKNLLKRFVRVTFAGTTITHDLAVVASAFEKYTEA